jgi:lantibiotic modifying enzyme
LSESQQESHPELEKTLTDSVTRVGLLPRPDSTRNTDISALGSPAKLKAAINSPFQRPYTSHRPTLGGKNVSLLEYRDEFCSQFSETYRAILENRDKLILDESPIHGFESAKIRVVVRPSLEYANVLQSKSNSERNELIAKLKADASSRRFLSPLIEDELRQLGEFDIPYFYTTPDSTDLRSPIGTTFHNFLEKPGIEVAKKRISNTSISDLHLQLEIINNSISKHSLS